MGGFFGAITKQDCVLDVFFGTDYHSHLGTKRGGMAVYDRKDGFQRQIHNIENTPFRTKFDKDLAEFHGCSGIGCISDTIPSPCWCAPTWACTPSPPSASSTTPTRWWSATSPTTATSSWP